MAWDEFRDLARTVGARLPLSTELQANNVSVEHDQWMPISYDPLEYIWANIGPSRYEMVAFRGSALITYIYIVLPACEGEDQDKNISEYAAGVNSGWVRGCADARPWCLDSLHGPTIRELCCNTCALEPACIDNDSVPVHALVPEGIPVTGCFDASYMCDGSGSPQWMQEACCHTCSLPPEEACVDNDAFAMAMLGTAGHGNHTSCAAVQHMCFDPGSISWFYHACCATCQAAMAYHDPSKCSDIGRDCCASATWGEPQTCDGGYVPIPDPSCTLSSFSECISQGHAAGVGCYGCFPPEGVHIDQDEHIDQAGAKFATSALVVVWCLAAALAAIGLWLFFPLLRKCCCPKGRKGKVIVWDRGAPYFYFLPAGFFLDSTCRSLPPMQHLRKQARLVKRRVCLSEAFGNPNSMKNMLFVSHRWESPEYPDMLGHQFAAIKEHLVDNPHIDHVWYDWCCMPQNGTWGGGQISRTPEDDEEFKCMLDSIADLYLTSSILILLDKTYMTRFWTLLEAWCSMITPTTSGVRAATSSERRFAMKTMHNAVPEDREGLEKLVFDKAPSVIHDVLACPDVVVTNMKDKDIMLPVVSTLDSHVKEVMRACEADVDV